MGGGGGGKELDISGVYLCTTQSSCAVYHNTDSPAEAAIETDEFVKVPALLTHQNLA